jgi:hypothetical protein
LKVLEMTNIDEDGNVSLDDIAIAVIFNGVLPRIIEEVLLYDHGIAFPPLVKREEDFVRCYFLLSEISP